MPVALSERRVALRWNRLDPQSLSWCDLAVLTIEPRAPAKSRCGCCGGSTTTLTRFVYRDGDAHAIYYARFSDDHPTASVGLLVSVGEYGEGASEEDRVAFAMELRPGDGVRVTDADESPWRDAKVVGRILNRPEGLAHPLLQEALHIVDHAVSEDEPLRAYLERAATFRPS